MKTETQNEMRRQMKYEDEILELIRDRDEFTQGDLQGLVSAIVMKIMREQKDL